MSAVDAPALSTELDALLAAVARTGQLVQQGELIDLTTLEEAVAGFCRRVETAAAGEGKTLRAGLIALMDELSRLDAAMRQAHAALGQQIGQTAQRRRAAAAYSGPVNPSR